MALYPTKRRFTVAEYYRIAAAGVLGEDDRVELIDGEVTQMTPVGSRHAACVRRLTSCFHQLFGKDLTVSAQDPIELDDLNEPQPDVTLLRRRPDFYASHHPTPKDVILAVEVGDSSVEYDRKIKAPLYAKHGIPELWVVDLTQDTVTVYGDPRSDGYRTARLLRRGDELAVSVFPDRRVAVAEIRADLP